MRSVGLIGDPEQVNSGHFKAGPPNSSTGSVASAGPTSHFHELDGIRGVLACVVMLMHYGMDRVVGLVTGGFLVRCEWGLSVDAFFVLSGFVLLRSYLRNTYTVRAFLIRRVVRLAPAYLLALAIVLCAGIPGTPAELVANSLLLQSIVGLRSLNHPSWSIPFELFLPIGAMIVVRTTGWQVRKPQHFLVLAALGGTCAVYALALGTDLRPLRALAGLLSGALLTLVWQRHGRGTAWPPSVLYALFAILLSIMVAADRVPAVTLLFYPAVLALVFVGTGTRTLFSSPVLAALGRWSYSIYLLHIPLLAVTTILLGDQAVGRNPLLKLVLALVVIGASAACHRYVEMPFMRLSVPVGPGRPRIREEPASSGRGGKGA